MTQTSRLVIEIDTGAAEKNAQLFNRELEAMTKSGDFAANAVDKVSAAARALAKSYLSVVAVSKGIALADNYTNLQNKLRLVTDGQDQLRAATQATFDIAQRTRGEWSAVTDVYSKFAKQANVLGLSQDNVGRLTETVSKTIALSGASAETASGALFQFGQALSGGVLRGEEFNSILEGTPALTDAIAKGLGVTAKQLRQMANDGKLSADVVVKALSNVSSSVDEDFAKTTSTVSQGFTQINNAVAKFVGENTSGAASMLADALGGVARNLDLIADTAAIAAIGYLTTAISAKTIAVGKDTLGMVANYNAGRQKVLTEIADATAVLNSAKAHTAYIQSTNAATQAKFGATAAAARYKLAIDAETAALVRLEAAQKASQVSSLAMAGVGTRLLGILGGPVGIGLTVASVAAGYLLMRDNADASNEALEKSAKYAGITADQMKRLSDSQKDVAVSDLQSAFKTQNDELEVLNDRFANVTRTIIFAAKQQGIYSKNAGEFMAIQQGVERGTLDYTTAIERLNKLDFLTVEQKKQLLDAANAYDKQYDVVTQSANSLKTFGKESQIAGSAAQNSANGINAQSDALGDVKKKAEDAAAALQKYIDKTKQGIFENQVQLRLRTKGFDPDEAKALTDLVTANGNKAPTPEQAKIALQGVASNRALAASNDRIAEAAKAAEKAEKDKAAAIKKAAEEAQRAYEGRYKEFESVVNSLADESVRIDKEYSRQADLIKQFANSGEQAGLLASAYAQAQQKQAELGVQNARNYNAYFEFENTRTDLIETHYEQEKVLAQNNAKYSEDERKKITEALERQKQHELDALKRAQAEQVLYAQQGYMTESGYMQERYRLEREEIQKNLELSEEYRKKLLEINQANIFVTRNQAGAAVGGIQQRFNEALMQRDNPKGFAQYQLQNQYETDSGALSGAYRNNQDAINSDPLLDQQQKEQQLLDAHQQYLSAKAAMDAEYNQQQQDLLNQQQAANLAAYSNIFGDLSGLARAFGGEQSSTYRALFAAQKAFALSSSLVNNWKTISDAYANEPGTIWNKIAAGVVAASETGVFSAAIQAVTPQGFATGGYTGPGGKYDVAGLVHKGEVVWSQEDIKRAGGVGTVEAMRTGTRVDNAIAAQSRSSGSSGNVYVYNNTSSAVSTQKDDAGNTYITIDDVRREIDSYVPAQLARPNSSISKGLKRNYNTESRR